MPLSFCTCESDIENECLGYPEQYLYVEYLSHVRPYHGGDMVAKGTAPFLKFWINDHVSLVTTLVVHITWWHKAQRRS